MGELSQATREIMWNISGADVMYLLFIVSLAIFAYGLNRRIKRWKRGRSDSERFVNLSSRFLFMVKAVVLQKKNWNAVFPGVFHAFFFYSFIVLMVTTLVILMDYDLGTHLFSGTLYAALTLASDIAGGLILTGVALALWRRYGQRPKTLQTEWPDAGILLLLALMVVTGFLIEGLRVQHAGDRWAALSPIGYLLSGLFDGMPEQSGKAWHAVLWWGHAVSVFAFISVIPYTKFFHLLAIPANAFFVKMKPPGELNRVDLEALMESDDFDEDDFNIGIDTTGDLTWKMRLDLDACVKCGRCEAVCPPYIAGQALSPKRLISGIKDVLYESEYYWDDKKEPASFFKEIVGNAFEENFIWLCRTCMACVEACPAFIGHVDTLIDIRRNEVNMKGRVHPEAARALRSVEATGNPFGAQEDRIEWVDTLDVPVIGPGESCDVLYWIGCLTTFDTTKQQIALDVIELLKKCDIDFGVLGPGELCCGDPARVTGDENLFQACAKQQVEELNQRKFKTLLTACPHCFNVLQNEYPQFGGRYHVVHYTQFLEAQMLQKKLVPHEIGSKVVVYHDPCYLGRYQEIYQPPRNVLNAIPAIRLREMKNSRGKSFCCGGGGGHFWMDIREGERINNLRVEQAAASGADIITTACPFCRHMLDDSLKLMDLEEKIEIEDVAHLLSRSLKQG